MADKILKSITFPNLPDKYIIPETTVDSAPTQGSTNAVQSGGVYEALQSAGLSEDAKTALLACFRHVAWIDEHGKDYYDALVATLAGVDTRLVYEITPNTDISDWSIDTQQHAFTLDEDFTFLAKVTTKATETSQTNMFLIDSQSTSMPTVGMRIQAPIVSGNFAVGVGFNGGADNNGAGGQTNNSFSISTAHNIIVVVRNENKTITIKTYVDGQLEYQDSRMISDKGNVYPPTYYIGKNHNDVERKFLGTVDIYRIYNEALTDSEIASILMLA